MTRDGAIDRLRKISEKTPIRTNGDDLVAITMAIQALSQEPSKDIKEIAEIMKCDADAETKCKMISNILTAKPHYFGEQEPTDENLHREREQAYMLGYEDASKRFRQEPTIGQLFSCEEVEELRSKIWKQVEQEPCEKCEVGNPCLYCEHEFSQKIEPCDDAISREEAIKVTCNDCQYDKCRYRESKEHCDCCGYIDRLRVLPSVTRKSGKWIALENRFELGDRVKCSECGQVFVVGDAVSRNFCPCCGCRMVEPRESEE